MNVTTLAIVAVAAIIVFHIVKSAVKPLMAAGVLGVTAIAAWSFWPSRNTPAALVAKSQQPVQALKAGDEEEATKKQATKKAAKASPLYGRTPVQIPPSGNQRSIVTTPLMVTPLRLPTPPVRNPTAEMLKQKRIQMQGPLSFDARMRAKKARAQQEITRQRQQHQSQAMQHQKEVQKQHQLAQQPQHQPQLAQKQPMRSGADIMNDFKGIRDRHAQKLQQKGVKPHAPVGSPFGNSGMTAGRWMPRMQMPNMGGHGGGHR